MINIGDIVVLNVGLGAYVNFYVSSDDENFDKYDPLHPRDCDVMVVIDVKCDSVDDGYYDMYQVFVPNRGLGWITGRSIKRAP